MPDDDLHIPAAPKLPGHDRIKLAIFVVQSAEQQLEAYRRAREDLMTSPALLSAYRAIVNII